MTDPARIVSEIYDIAVIGGGINGVGIAADAAGRGLSVFLCERDDLASHTSSASSKLIHGGLRYLEHYEFRLVRESLAEREVLLAKAPHIIRPLRFVLPHRPHLRPAWVIRAGLFLYDHLGRRKRLPASRSLHFGADSPLKPDIRRGFEYADCQVDDARLVVLNAMAAREKGAHIHTRTRCLSARRDDGLWHLELQQADGTRLSLCAKALVNATGPWVAQFLWENLQQRSPYRIRLVQGSHLIVPRLYEGEQAYILQSEDQRIVFVIPYLEHYTLIGTTDREYRGDPAKVAISEDEIRYLLEVSNAHFRRQLTARDILHSFAGVRPLRDDQSNNPAVVTRDYSLSLTTAQQAPLLSVFGGKLTTYRRLAEAVLTQLGPYFVGMGAPWTASESLPGGEDMSTPQALAEELKAKVQGLDESLAQRWASLYGNRVWRMLGEARAIADLGECLGQDLYAQEVDYLCREEWATQAEDILWRRTKLGLTFTPREQERLRRYLKLAAPAPS